MSWSQKIHYTFSYIPIIAVPSPTIFFSTGRRICLGQRDTGLGAGFVLLGLPGDPDSGRLVGRSLRR